MKITLTLIALAALTFVSIAHAETTEVQTSPQAAHNTNTAEPAKIEATNNEPSHAEAVHGEAIHGETSHGGHEVEAEMPTWEISGGTNAILQITSFGDDSENERRLRIFADVDYFVDEQFEFGVHGLVDLAHTAERNTNVFELLVGPTYNFNKDVENSFFIQAKVGLQFVTRTNTAPNYSRLAYLIGVGRRFEIVPHLSYMPELALEGFGSTNVNAVDLPSEKSLQLIPLQFSFSY